MLLAELSDASDDIIDILWGVADDLSLAGTSLGLWEVVETVVEVSANSEEHLLVVNVFTEVHVVYFVEVTLVHVSAEEHLRNVVWSRNPEQVEHAEELGLGHMAVLRDVEVLEDWLQVDSHVGDSLAVLIQQRLDHVLTGTTSEVLAASEQSVADNDWSDSSLWCLVNASDGEGSVDCGNKVLVTEEFLGVASLVLIGECFELIVSQLEVHRGENCLELGAGNTTFAEFVKVVEELLDSDSLHDNDSSNTVFSICWVGGDVDSWLTETVVENINFFGWLFEEHALLGVRDAENGALLRQGVLSDVGGEHVLGTIDILAEVVIVNVLIVALVAVLADHQVEKFVTGRHDVESLHHTQELGGTDMVALGAVKVHEGWLEQDSV